MALSVTVVCSRPRRFDLRQRRQHLQPGLGEAREAEIEIVEVRQAGQAASALFGDVDRDMSRACFRFFSLPICAMP